MDAEWVMVWITAVYVIATILICYANLKSARATREQVLESQRQFEETKRLERMPYFDVSVAQNFNIPDVFDTDITVSINGGQSKEVVCSLEWLQFTNIGYGTATDLSFTSGNAVDVLPMQFMPSKTFQEDKKGILGIRFDIPFPCDSETHKQNISLSLNYQDLLGNRYQQELVLSFCAESEKNVELSEVRVSIPQLINNK